MGKKRKKARNRHGLQAVTLCISTALVLVLLGLTTLSVLTARNLSAYVKENIEFVKQYVEEQFPGVNMVEHEGTYLVWLDFRGTGLSVEELDDKIINQAKLWLDSGKIFGSCGEGFQRINVACPRKVLEEALERIKNAVG